MFLIILSADTAEPSDTLIDNISDITIQDFWDNMSSAKPVIGGCLIRYVVDHYGVNDVNVNEQNPQAINFYKHMGFHSNKRTDFDEHGAAYPLLYMQLDK